MQAAQDINVGVRLSRGGFEYTLQAVNIAELIEWSQKLLDKMRSLPEIADATRARSAKTTSDFRLESIALPRIAQIYLKPRYGAPQTNTTFKSTSVGWSSSS
jgi:hypothetical protein